MKKLLLLTLSLFVGLGIAFAFTYEWVIDDMEYANDAAAQAAYVRSTTKATGGTITYDGDYVIHTFLSDGTFTPNSAFNVEYLIVAGGGGGGGRAGGGGGSGGVLTDVVAVTAGVNTVTIGVGGVGGAADGSTKGTSGNNSVFDTIIATGGGGGGSGATEVGTQDGVDGGSGGGAGATGAIGSVGAGVAGQGHDGGLGEHSSGVSRSGGGGGGKEAVGQNSAPNTGGDGGIGVASSISGSSVYYGGGGGGGTYTSAPNIFGTGGNGGGGDGGNNGTAPTVGVANTGGGGGGGSQGGSGDAGEAGGSGIVIIRYLGGFNLQSYSEPTIKTQGSYSLKGVAAITDSLNDTLTRTLDDNLDLSNSEGIEYDIYALRTGSNIKIGIHDSGGTTSEHTANVATSNTNQTESWDISGVADANKDDIDSIVITISNADAANTFYLDDMKWGIDAAGGGNWTWVQ